MSTGQRCNSLIDSLLQALLALDIINGPSADDKPLVWRHEVCELTRKHLCEHVDVCLRPRVRSQEGEAVVVTPDVHARAFLDHYKHAAEIVLFLIERFGFQNPNDTRPVRIFFCVLMVLLLML